MEEDIEKRKSNLANNIRKIFFSWVKDNYDKVFIAVLIAAFVIRLYIFFQTMNQPLWWDEADYLSAAKRWGLGMNIRDIWYYRRGFLLPLIGALIFRLGIGEIGMRFLEVLCSMGIIVVSYFIIESMFNKKLALLTSVALSLSWILLFFTGRILSDIPSAFFVLLSLLLFWKGYILKQGNKFIYLFGLFFALAVLIRMQSLMFIPPFLIYIFVKERLKVFKNKQLWIALGIFLLLLMPHLIMYSSHYGNPLTDLASHYLGIGTTSSPLAEGNERTFSMATFNYFTNLPYMMSLIMFISLIIGAIYFFTDLFIGLDKILKNEELQNKLFILFWILSLFFIMGYIGAVSYVEQRYITAGLPFLFLIAVSPILLVGEMMIKKFNPNRKLAMFVIFMILISLMIPNILLANSLLEQQGKSYLQVKQVGELIKADSYPGDIVISTSLPQITYYSERSTYPFDVRHDGMHKGDKELLKYKDGLEGFEEFLLEKKPRYIMASLFELDPEWILTKGTSQNGINIITLPFFNSSLSYNSQNSQMTSLDLKNEVKKGNLTLELFYPTTQEGINGIFIYKVRYS